MAVCITQPMIYNAKVTVAGIYIRQSITFRPDDEPFLFSIVKSLPIKYDDGNWHAAFMDIEDGIKYMRGKPKTDILEYLYRNTLCGDCREHIVRLMHKKKVLTKAILQECRFDSNSDIRAFTEKIKLPQ